VILTKITQLVVRVLCVCVKQHDTMICLDNDTMAAGRQQRRLIRHLLNPDRYDKKIRPVRNISHAITVTLRMNLYMILDVVSNNVDNLCANYFTILE
jgi:hypothetical protein